MRPTSLKTVFRTATFACAGLLLGASETSAFAADVYLRAEPFDKTLPWGETVPMWGYALCDAGWVNCELPTAPAPRLDVAVGEPLTVHLQNTLDTPTSFFLPSQPTGGNPVMEGGRVRSFTQEAVPGGGTATYSFTNLRPGTYLYESGTYPPIEVPMGLYGALVVGPATGVACAAGTPAYDAESSCYDADTLLVFSEIDPWLNDAVSSAGGDVGLFPSTIDYAATYFLVNGEPTAPATAGSPGDNVLLRFVNAGLESHIPSIIGAEMSLVAEDGFPYSGVARQQASLLLPAGKSADVLIEAPATDATLALYDRMPPGSSDHQASGSLAYLDVGLGGSDANASFTVADEYAAYEETSFSVASTEGVLANDVGLGGATVTLSIGPAHGTLTLASDGTFTYTSDANFAGVDGFDYIATVGASAYTGHASIYVLPSNDPPTASDDGPYANSIGPNLVVDAAHGVLGNDADPDGDTLTAVLVSPPASGSLTLNGDGSFSYVGGTANTTVTFTYRASDGLATSDIATATIRVLPVANLALTVKEPGGALVTSYRWVVQEDRTFQSNPTTPPALSDTQSTNFHKSYMPVVAQGHGSADFAQLALDLTKPYYVSVMPDDGGTDTGHTLGGARILPGATAVTVLTNLAPVPTGRISIIVFEDNAPTNGVFDPVEPRLGGFEIHLEDAGGRYGASGGPVSQDAFGNPLKNSLDCFGDSPPPEGVILSCPDGTVLVENLAPGKYGMMVDPPAGGEQWIQTSTIEGTRIVDAWIQANEPPYMLEFGVASFHGMFGFVNPTHNVVPADVPDATHDITGFVTLFHDQRPPTPPGTTTTGSFAALGFTRAWVGLNSVAGDGPSWATVHAETDGSFTIPNIPDGTYQLVVWDDFLDVIINFQVVTVAGGDVNVGEVPVNAWFTRQEHTVFLDENEDGIRQESEQGLFNQNVNLRWRDGTVNQAAPTDSEGFVPFDEVFPFFSWQVAEVDYGRFKPTGLTVTVDAGGAVDTTGPYAGILATAPGTPETQLGPVLLQAFQGFGGQTNVFDWGKVPYKPGENGGISGIVYYASTRGENDPRLTVGDPWEGGLPGVKVRLYKEIMTDLAGTTSLALVQEVETDSWDDAVPTGCKGENAATPFVTTTLGSANLERCYDGWRNWNQSRPGVFDGGYAFSDIEPGTYVVEVVPPPGYELYKEEDKNVDFGDVFATAPVAVVLPGGAVLPAVPDQAIAASGTLVPGLAQPECVGAPHLVPDELALFPGVETWAPFAGTERPLCDRKRVILEDQSNGVADFHLFTTTPVAAQYTGLILDDLAAETNLATPNAGEKWGPAFLPFSMRDYAGNEVYRGYSDAFGRYNGLAASTFSANIPMPSGYSPAMLSACLNDPGDGAIPDPNVNPAYGTFCYPLQFMPRATTYLDTPILPQTAFAAGYTPPDCAMPTGTPVVTQVDGTGVGPLVATGGTLTIKANATTQVPNPQYEGPFATTAPYNQVTISRDTGFGTTTGTVTVNGTPLTITSWSATEIKATIPTLNAGTGELVVKRGDNAKTSTNAVTVTIGTETPVRVSAGGSIQAAIDSAANGALILVGPGTYKEAVVMWKPVRLQGVGAATVINAMLYPVTKLDVWKDKVQGLLDAGSFDVLPGQPLAIDLVGGGLFANQSGPGVLVVAKNNGTFAANASRIDGFTITGAQGGGGIFVNGYAHNLQIANNTIVHNSGSLHGGIGVGELFLAPAGDGPFAYNTGLNIHHNAITLNGAVSELGAGGGVSIATGTDGYKVADNFVCGNITSGDGGGIGHIGYSANGVIERNQVLFNESYNLSFTRGGGGIWVGGEPVEPGNLTLGSGSVTIDSNRIIGNQAASGHGGGIRAEFVNGRDVELNGATTSLWHLLTIKNNLITNNVAGWSGGGVSLQDAVNVNVMLNTIANNDSTATVGALYDAVTGTSPSQPAGVSSAAHSADLATVMPAAVVDQLAFSKPRLTHNILWHNRSFSYSSTVNGLLPALSQNSVGECPAGAVYWDVGVIDPEYALDPKYSILTSGIDTNLSSDPQLSNGYCNGARDFSAPLGGYVVFGAAAEGGNFLDVRYGPLTQSNPTTPLVAWDYHIKNTSPARDFQPAAGLARDTYLAGITAKTSPAYTGVTLDFDRQKRSENTINRIDIGADEIFTPSMAALDFDGALWGQGWFGTAPYIPQANSLGTFTCGWKNASSPLLVTGDLPPIGTQAIVRLKVPVAQSNPWWIGDVTLFVEIPSAGIWNQWIGNSSLNALPRGVFTDVKWTLPANVQTALKAPHSDVRFRLQINTGSCLDVLTVEALGVSG